MSYATITAVLADEIGTGTKDGKEIISAACEIPGEVPVKVELSVPATASAVKALREIKVGERLIASGPVQLINKGAQPQITALVVCPATEEQYLNEVIVVGRVGGEPKTTESGKSSKRSVAVNRYRRKPDSEEVEELTDWHGIRAFGFNKEKLERIKTGSLVMISGALSQMTNAKGEPYCEIKARTITVHKGGKGKGPDLGDGSKAAGYDADAFMGDPGDIASDWD